MELMNEHEHGFIDELLALSRENFPSEDLFSNVFFDDNNFLISSSTTTSSSSCSQQLEQDQFNNYYYFNQNFPFSPNFTDHDFTAPQLLTDSSSYNALDTPPFHQPNPVPAVSSNLDDDDQGLMSLIKYPNKMASYSSSSAAKIEEESPVVFNIGNFPDIRNNVVIRGKKLGGQPSKNLMAERRRRKRLNDRLFMLRSIVPKISKMDRTSILGDTIDYVKELLDKINNLQKQIDEPSSNDHQVMGILKDSKASEFMIRNSPKFDVERRNKDTQIEMCCSSKPGLLLSTVSTLEALGLEIQQCVISCFNDFALQASCSQELENRNLQSCEDIKQALFRSAGYGGRCL